MSEPLWSFDAFVTAIEGRPVGLSRETVSGISIDSRTVQPGDAFFAIRGDNFDGHDYVTMALAGGATVAVISEAKLAALGHITGSMVVVDDVLAALVRLGRAARARSQARIAAVTGSVGKTGTKTMLARALAPDRVVHASPASFNNHLGVPLTLSRMPPEAEFGIFEIGMNHAGEIEPLVGMVRS
ncbi:MAG: UDP-N-acetylmuramoylalanyl-D-glutamyl-2, 6-diaminopimelate--D-alanyl-D-alanine ligase, partial [Bauldia sp.]|nr:UDP-N-acetylmuramoylalanyl-D-glutamyl-2, 6-diaminopimelate--D-alanyl-D-alanine ligase [Bauldia sp.]